MSSHLGHLSTLLVAMMLAAVPTADSVASAAGNARGATPADDPQPAQPPIPAHEGADPAQGEDKDEPGVDLGLQPVLLLDRTLKPAAPSIPLHPLAPVDGTVVPLACPRPIVERAPWLAEPDDSRQPRRHAGIALWPHGPPA